MNQPKQPTALIVDDEPDIRELLDITLSGMGITTFQAGTLQEAKHLLATQQFDFCLTDMRLPDGSGLELVDAIRRQNAQIPVAVITAYGSVETAVEALKNGAFDFINKPIELEVLRGLVAHALRLAQKLLLQTTQPSRLLGESPPMLQLKAKIKQVARTQAPVLIQGETGTGKELVAKEIHELGPRAGTPFIAVNCGAIPSELMESEFFGHKKGSFTGAVADKKGLFQAAEGGTLFLDEVAELPLQMQVKLLRVIQERKVRAVGTSTETAVDVRILSATHQDLQQRVDDGQFRLDLYYRLNVITLHVAPLRERSEDIELLASHILGRITAHWGAEPMQISDAAVEKLYHYAYPGNVRELENILERAATFSEGVIVSEADISMQSELEQIVSTSLNSEIQPTPGETERDALFEVLQQTRWNRTKAAEKLGLTLRQIRYRIKKYELG